MTLIIEFPLVKDIKSRKWTNVSGKLKKEQYNCINLLKYSKDSFQQIL